MKYNKNEILIINLILEKNFIHFFSIELYPILNYGS